MGKIKSKLKDLFKPADIEDDFGFAGLLFLIVFIPAVLLLLVPVISSESRAQMSETFQIIYIICVAVPAFIVLFWGICKFG